MGPSRRSKNMKRLSQADRTKTSGTSRHLAEVNEQIRGLRGELRELRRLAREGVLAVEMLRLRPDAPPEVAGYEGLRREALRTLIQTEGLVEKLGLRIDSRSEFADKYALGASTAPCDELVSICRGSRCKEKFPLTMTLREPRSKTGPAIAHSANHERTKTPWWHRSGSLAPFVPLWSPLLSLRPLCPLR